METIILERADEELRGSLTRLVAELGYAPGLAALSQRTGIAEADVEMRMRRLADAHALLLHPGTSRPWAVHPFALAPGSTWVKTSRKGYWANCLYCGLGIAAALKCDAVITTRLGGEDETVEYFVTAGVVSPSEHLFHLSTPVRAWWDNVVFACSSFQPFKTQADIDRWCAAHDLPRGAVMTIPQLWGFAQDWYGDYVDQPWRKRTAAEIVAIFERHGLTGPFWTMS